MAKMFAPTAVPASVRAARRAGHGYGETARPNWRSIDWLEHLHQVNVAGTPVNYVDIGSGELEPIVFVHGLGGQWENWLENLPRAALERRVIALDCLDWRTPMPATRHDLRLRRCVDALCDQLDQVAWKSWAMDVGTSQPSAIQFPQRIEHDVGPPPGSPAPSGRRLHHSGRIATAMTARCRPSTDLACDAFAHSRSRGGSSPRCCVLNLPTVHHRHGPARLQPLGARAG